MIANIHVTFRHLLFILWGYFMSVMSIATRHFTLAQTSPPHLVPKLIYPVSNLSNSFYYALDGNIKNPPPKNIKAKFSNVHFFH